MKFESRGILVHPEDLTMDWLNKMSAAGLNSLGLHPVGGNKSHNSMLRAIDWHTLPETRALFAEAARLGISVEYEAHSMGWLLPRHLFSLHPEWFRMNENGERTPDHNFCVSNPDALAYVAERAALLAKLLPTGSSKYYYWLDDVSGGACHCPACRALSASDQQLRAVNAMLSGLRTVDPQAQLCYIAYHETLAVPRCTEPADGVFLEYAPFRRDHHRPLNDASCEKNVIETAPLKDLIAFFGKKDARALDYWMDNSLFSGWTKPPKAFSLDEDVMRRDCEYYASLGMEHVTSFGCYLGPDYQQLHGDPSLSAYGSILSADY